jgi:hypothetical protein
LGPYGLAVTKAGSVRAANNAPIGQPDHLSRADLGPRPGRPANITSLAPGSRLPVTSSTCAAA